MKFLSLALVCVCINLYSKAPIASSHAIKEKPSAQQSSFFNWRCSLCEVAAIALKDAYFSGKSQDCVAAIAAQICTAFQIEDSFVCKAILSLYKDEVLYVIGELILNPRQFCGFLMSNCTDPFNPLNNTWQVNIPPPRPNPPPSATRQTNANVSSIRVLQLSDIHFDALYEVGTEADCSFPLCCRRRANSTQPKKPADKWGTVAKCDTPLRLLENLFQHLSQNETFDYMLWTGDLPAHNVWNQTKSDQLAIYQTLVDMLIKYFPQKLIFSALGNHESAPADSFPPHFPTLPQRFSISWLYDALAEHWTRWIPKSSMAVIKRKASYVVQLFKGLRLISINTNYCINTNFWLYLNDTDPDGDLQWLVDQLYEAEGAGDKVHIIGHIPSGDSTCLPQWSANYYRIVNRFEKTIAGQFFGHTHQDQYAVFYENANFSQRATNVMYVAPSVTTYDSFLPAYRIYTVNTSSWQVSDFETHYVNLTEANASDHPEWKFEYSAKAAYGLGDLSPGSWNHLIDRMAKNETLAKLFVKHLYRQETPCDTKCILDILCQLRSARSHDPNLCSDLVPRNITRTKHAHYLDYAVTFFQRSNLFSLPSECKIGGGGKNGSENKQVRFNLSAINSSNCKIIETECKSQDCGQMCEAIVAAHSRMGRPSKLNELRKAVCQMSTQCCCVHTGV